jgi:formate-dependent nitrite reductase membrane component NrfD
MSWGSWGLLVFFPICLLFAYGTMPEQRREWFYRLPFMDDLAAWIKPRMQQIALANAAMGVFIGIYTGVLLSSFVARPLWNSAILPMLFLCSALSAGAALMIILAKNQCVKLFFTKIDIGLILAEMIIIPIFFYSQYTSSEAHRLSILPFFSLSSEYLWYTASLLFIGVVFPLALVMKLAEIKECHESFSKSDILKMNLSALLVLAGGLVIRLTFVYAGQLSKLV